jgi:hypothetical protein
VPTDVRDGEFVITCAPVKARSPVFVLVFAAVGAFVPGVAGVGCSSSDAPAVPVGPAADTPGTQADLDKAIDARAAAFCDRVFACCEAASKTQLLNLYATADVPRDQCEAKIKDWLKAAATGAATSLARKDLEFFPSKEAKCLEADAAKSCTDFFALGAATEPRIACPEAFTGKAAEGAACSSHAACVSGFCKLPLDGESGVCAPFPQEGDACSGTEECGGAGLYCFRTGAPPACKFGPGTCKARDAKADGESCCNPEECEGQTCSLNKKGQPICNQQNRLKCDQ